MHGLATTFAGWPLTRLYNQRVATDKADSAVVRESECACPTIARGRNLGYAFTVDNRRANGF